ncbi:zinc-ribbon domain-containing protein [Nocardia gipuzkoensis]
MEEWHPDRNTPLTPNDVQPGSVRSVWWRCAEGHEWSTPIKYRVRGTTCPTCRSRRRGH